MNENKKKDASHLPAKTGVIHGRFQILHNDHMKYILSGKALCDHLVIGITNPDPTLTKKEAADPSRDDRFANPLTYYERYTIINAALKKSGLDHDEFSIVPFPINIPELYQYYVPMDAVFFLTIYDDWGRQKLRYFDSLGLKTHVLWEVPSEEKGISACEIRDLIKKGKPWEHLVPTVVFRLIIDWNVSLRLR